MRRNVDHGVLTVELELISHAALLIRVQLHPTPPHHPPPPPPTHPIAPRPQPTDHLSAGLALRLCRRTRPSTHSRAAPLSRFSKEGRRLAELRASKKQAAEAEAEFLREHAKAAEAKMESEQHAAADQRRTLEERRKEEQKLEADHAIKVRPPLSTYASGQCMAPTTHTASNEPARHSQASGPPGTNIRTEPDVASLRETSRHCLHGLL